MSIKYDAPKIISFVYEGETESDIYSIKYDKENEKIYFKEGKLDDKNDEWYAFPFNLLLETVDFIKNKENFNTPKTESKLPIPNIKKSSSLPIEAKKEEKNVSFNAPSYEEIAKSSDDHGTFESFSQQKEKETDTIEMDKVIEEKPKEEKEKMVKRPVLDGNMPIGLASEVRGVGDESKKIKKAHQEG